MCAQCKRNHLKARSSEDHDVTPLALKVEQIKRDVRQQATPARQRAATMTSHVAQLQQALEKLDVKQAEFLQQSDDLRKKYIQQINDHFDALNTKAINFIHEEAAKLRNRKKEAEKSLEAVNSRLQTLEELLADNSPGLTVQGKKILEELAALQNAPINAEVTVTEPDIRLEEVKPFDAGDMVLLKTAQGKAELGIPSQDIHKLSSLRQKQFVQGKAAKLVRCPQSVQYIRDRVWTCQDQRPGTVQIFDRDLKLLRTLSDQQWGDVCDVTELPNGDVALAGSGGLYHLTSTGENKTAIDTESKYFSSVVVDDKLFAYCNKPPRLIVYTLQNDRWETHDTISLADVVEHIAYVTLATANDKIFACSAHDGKVFVLSQSGEVLQTHGKPRSVPDGELSDEEAHQTEPPPAGELYMPRLCAVDSEESMLVADRDNDRLQVCDVTGQWSVLDLQPSAQVPNRAAVIDNKLYVCFYLEKTLSVYASE